MSTSVLVLKSKFHNPNNSVDDPINIVDDGETLYYQSRHYRTFVHSGPKAKVQDELLREGLKGEAWQPGFMEDVITSP